MSTQFGVVRAAPACCLPLVTRRSEPPGESFHTLRSNTKSEQVANRSSLGVLGMRERVHLIGGEIDFKGVEGEGTVVTARVPISKEA